MKIRLLPAAEAELAEAVSWYEARASGLGRKFLVEVRAGQRRILRHPLAWHLLEGGVRRYRLRTFPYGLIYSVESDEIVLLAVAHSHRAPDYWRNRMH